MLSNVRLFATPWTVAHQALLSMRFPRQEYWSRLPFSPPGHLPDLGIEPASPALAGDSLPPSHLWSPPFTLDISYGMRSQIGKCSPFVSSSSIKSSKLQCRASSCLQWLFVMLSRILFTFMVAEEFLLHIQVLKNFNDVVKKERNWSRSVMSDSLQPHGR